MARLRTGIEITAGQIHAAQVRLTPAGWSLRASATMSRSQSGEAIDADETTALESLLFRKGFQRTLCVVNAPESALRAATLPLPPPTSGAPIGQLARMEFARHHKIDPGQFELSYWPLPGTGPGVQVMALGCDVAPTDQRVAALESAGLCVAGVDDAARALGRVVSRCPWTSGVRVGARLDPWGAMIVVLHDGVMLYTRRPVGLALRDPSDASVASSIHSLANEIDACVSFARHRCRSHAPATIGLFGLLGRHTMAREILERRYGRSLAIATTPDGTPFDVEYGAAIGLALLEDAA